MGVKKIPVSHARASCIGCGSCVLLDPKHRTMDAEDGKATLCGAKRKGKSVMVSSIDADDLKATKQAQLACPVNIIQVHN